MQGNKLYKTIDEIRSHCPDSLIDSVDYVTDQYLSTLGYDEDAEAEDEEGDYELAEMYARIVVYMDCGSLYDKNYLLDNSCRHYKQPDDWVTYYLPKEYNATDEAVVLSSLLHVMHQKYPKLRNEAMKICMNVKNDLLRNAGCPSADASRVFFDSPEFLSGKSGFPPYIRELVEQKLSWMEDVGLNFEVTWGYSHLDCGFDYDYGVCESAYVEVYSPYPDEIGRAVRILEGITFEEIIEQKMDYDERWKQSIRFEKYKDEIGFYKPDSSDGICADYKNIDMGYSCESRRFCAMMIKPCGNEVWPMITVGHAGGKKYELYVNSRYCNRDEKVMKGESWQEYEKREGRLCMFGADESYIRFAFGTEAAMYDKRDSLMGTVIDGMNAENQNKEPPVFYRWSGGDTEPTVFDYTQHHAEETSSSMHQDGNELYGNGYCENGSFTDALLNMDELDDEFEL